MEVTPLVSICCLTYNHEKYIRDALNGFIMQKTNFPIEILIHDDASTDNTTLIIKEYETKHPDVIKPIYQTKNQWSIGIKPTFKYNFPRAKGKYIALCEGDDYWTDPYKLQKQVDFLEEKKEYILSFHNTKVKNELQDTIHNFNAFPEEKSFTIKDVLNEWIIGTQTMLFRNKLNELKFPTNFTNYYSPDRCLQILLATQGKIKYFPECMAVYRINGNSITQRMDYGQSPEFYDNVKDMFIDLKLILKKEHHSQLNSNIKKMTEEGEVAKAIAMSEIKNKKQTLIHLIKSLKYHPFRFVKYVRLYGSILKKILLQ